MELDALKWDAAGLVTVVVQDRMSGEIRMLAHADRDAVAATIETGEAHFYSRSRKAHWRKGESSGNTIAVAEVWADCDADALVYMSDPRGPSCHTGAQSCFFQRLDAPDASPRQRALPLLPRLFAELAARRDADEGSSYTRKLLTEGAAKIGAKVREEAGEFDDAIQSESDERVVSEAADVVYHLLVGLLARGVELRDVDAELARRFGVSGLIEKASRPKPAGDDG